MSKSSTVSLGGYIAARLAQMGCRHVFGLPGDFNLALVDELLAGGTIAWVGSANELNASYSADGYARIRRGLGALVTTYGVGELSAVNGTAGSYAEDVPVVHIVGMPTRSARLSDQLLHHTLADGDHDHFVRMQREVNAVVDVVHSAVAAPATIDHVMASAIALAKPVYLGVPSDLADAQIDATALATPLRATPPASDPFALARLTELLTPLLSGPDTTSIVALTGARAHRFGAEEPVRALARLRNVTIANQLSSKAMVDESEPGSIGTYAGAMTVVSATRDAVDTADVVITIGTVDTDFMTGFFTATPAEHCRVQLQNNAASVDGVTLRGISLRDAVNCVVSIVASTSDAHQPTAVPIAECAVDDSRQLDHDNVWPVVQRHIRADSLLVAEAGTAYYGALSLHLPAGCDFLGQPIWSSIGYTLPATLGAVLANPNRAAMLLIGDGAAQLTIQELGTLLRQPAAPTILLLNNNGYTIERLIRSPEAVYQDVTPWNWTALPAAMGAADAFTTTVATTYELDAALATASASPGALIEILLPERAAPPLLEKLAGGLK